MKIILCGKNDSAVECLEFLVARGDEVWAIGTKGDDGKDGWQKSFKGAALRLKVPFEQPPKINDPSFIKRLTDYRAAVLVSIQYDQILKDPLFNAIGCPCINLHFALLPRNRGVAPIAWAVLNGDRETGATMHHMIEDIDAGDLIDQEAVPISMEDTARQVYDNVSAAAVVVFKRLYPFSQKQLSVRLPQDRAVASYHKNGEFDFSTRRVNWNRPAMELHRWIRSMIFPPFQYPLIEVNGGEIAITRMGGEIKPANQAEPGRVMALTTQSLDVAVGGGVIQLCGLLDSQSPSRTFSDLTTGIKVGDRLA
ncbi:MAG TPA: formyltransferase family protein [Phycisphaerae bacterium]|nr:formyltransferase family protein [Phycisphaerae bacterium]